jgi:hypothetical protein
MSVYVYPVFYVLLCVGNGLETGWLPVQEVLPAVFRIRDIEKEARSQKRTVEQ